MGRPGEPKSLLPIETNNTFFNVAIIAVWHYMFCACSNTVPQVRTCFAHVNKLYISNKRTGHAKIIYINYTNYRILVMSINITNDITSKIVSNILEYFWGLRLFQIMLQNSFYRTKQRYPTYHLNWKWLANMPIKHAIKLHLTNIMEHMRSTYCKYFAIQVESYKHHKPIGLSTFVQCIYFLCMQ